MARIARALHDRRWYHKDFYLCHFYLPESDTGRVPGDWAGRVFLIDFHRLARHRTRSFLFQMKDLAQLLYSSAVPGVTDRDRAYFWRCYRAGRSLPWLRRAVLLKASRYRRHHEKRAA
jgi:heptose I phosphotransferase